MKLQGLFLRENNEVTGNTQNELEYTFLAKLSDFEQLNKCDESEEYEQWMIMSEGKNKSGGQIRVRSINDSKYIFTVKNNTNDSKKSKETETEVTKDMFDAFKKLAVIGTKKKRFKFKVDEYEFEIDAFYKSEDSKEFHEWVQIDLEVEKAIKSIPDFPIECDEYFDAHKEKEKASKIYSMLNLKKEGNILPILEH